MAGNGIFIKVLPKLEMAALAATIVQMENAFKKAGLTIDKSLKSANDALKKTQDEVERTAAAEKKLADQRKRDEADLQVAKERTNQATQAQAALESKRLNDVVVAEANLERVRQANHSNQIARLQKEAQAEDDLDKAAAKRQQAAKLTAADSAAQTKAQADLENARNRANLDTNAPILAATEAENRRRQELTDTINAQAAAHDEHTRAVNANADAHDRLNSQVSNSNRGLMMLGAGSAAVVGAVGYESIKTANEVQQNMNRLVTMGQEKLNSIGSMTQQVYQLSTQVPFKPQELSEGLGLVEKAGYRGGDALNVMSVAAKTAIATGGDLKETLEGLTTSYNDMGISSETGTKLLTDMNQIAGQLIVTMRDLKTTDPSSLFKGFYAVEPTAKTYMSGLIQQQGGAAASAQINAALDILSQTGMSMEQGSQNLSGLISALGAPQPGGKTYTTLGQLGLVPENISKDVNTQGFMPALKTVVDAVNAKTIKGGPNQGLVDIGWRYNNQQTQDLINQDLAGLSDPAKNFLAQHPEIEKGIAQNFLIQKALKDTDISGQEGQDILTLSHWEAMLHGQSKNVKAGGATELTQGQVAQLLFGSGDRARTFLALTANPEQLLSKPAEIGEGGKGNALEEAFHQAMETNIEKWRQLGSNVGSLAGRIGNDLLPVLSGVIDGFKGMMDFLGKHKTLADELLIAMAALVGAAGFTKLMSGIAAFSGALDIAKTTFGTTVVKSGTDLSTQATQAGDELKAGASTTRARLEGAGTNLDADAAAAGTELKSSAMTLGGKFRGLAGGLAGVIGMIGTSFLPNSAPGSDWVNAAAGLSWLAGPEVGIPVTAVAATWDYMDGGQGKGPNFGFDTNVYGPTPPPVPGGLPLPGQAPPGMASGGVLPGYSPGKDNLLGMVNGRPIGLSGGEGIAVPEFVQAIGPGNFMALNRYFSGGRKPGGGGMASGGVLPAIADAMTSFLGNMWGFPAGVDPWQAAGMYQASMSGGMPMAAYGSMPMMGGIMPSGGLKGIAQQLFSRFGWGAGEWSAFDQLITKESNWDPTAKNPSSTAYGLGQFLDTTGAEYPGSRSSNPVAQLIATMQYVRNKYGTPSAAWAFHKSHNWYAGGGIAGGGNINPGISIDTSTTNPFVSGAGFVPAMLWGLSPTGAGGWDYPVFPNGQDPSGGLPGWSPRIQARGYRWSDGPQSGFSGGGVLGYDGGTPALPYTPGIPFGPGDPAGQPDQSNSDTAINALFDGLKLSSPGMGTRRPSSDPPGMNFTVNAARRAQQDAALAAAEAAAASHSGSAPSSSSSADTSSDTPNLDPSFIGAGPGNFGMPSLSGYGMPMSFSGTAANVMSFANFAQSLPYNWGGFSINGVDCSGLALAFANVATGRSPFDRNGGGVHPMSTMNEGDYLSSMGFQEGFGGPGSLTIGWDGEHTGITLPDGTNIEAMDSKDGVVMGKGSKGARNPAFTRAMHLDLPGMQPGGMPSMMGMPGMGGFPGMGSSKGFQGADMGGSVNPLQAATKFSHGNIISGLVSLMTTFLLELAMGNPLGRLMAGQDMAGNPLNGNMTNGLMPNGTVSPFSPQFAPMMNANTDALTNFNGASNEQIQNTVEQQNALLRIQSAQGRMARAKTPAQYESASIALQEALNSYQGLGARQGERAARADEKLGDSPDTLSRMQADLKQKTDRLHEQQANPKTKPSAIEATQNEITGINDRIRKYTDRTIPNLQAQAGANAPIMGNANSPIGYPGSPGGYPDANTPIGYAGEGAPFGGNMVSPNSFWGSNSVQGSPSPSMAGAPGAPAGMPLKTRQPSEGQGGSGAGGKANNPFGGLLSMAGSALSSAASAAGNMFAPGSGAAASEAIQIGEQELNRLAAYGGQVAGIMAMAPFETFFPNLSESGDMTGGWIGKALKGGLGAVMSSGPNVAGKTQPPLQKKPDEHKGGPDKMGGNDHAKMGDANNAKKDHNVIGQYVENQHFHNSDTSQVTQDIHGAMGKFSSFQGPGYF